ncbi:MAG TPA: hypothetical protein VKO86_12730, partial [Gemmatimonadales bacterium]|nr:hypothetical protein [Gemmatimonadales bacterium]
LWVPLDDVREALATRVMECAGAARRDAADAAPARALRQLDRDAWSDAWNEAVRRAAERVAHGLDAALALEARRVRMPAHRSRQLPLSPAERRAIAARLASGAEGFEAALGEVARATDALHRDWPGDAETIAEWRAAQELAARRLEAAWLALEALVGQERTRWTPELDGIRAWRPSLAPVFAVWLPLAAVIVWLALVMGGYLSAPAWLAAALGF